MRLFAPWEYWPMSAFYWPLSPYFGYLALRCGHPCFFTASNPGIEAGGIGFESKYSTLQQFPAKYLPKTVFAKNGQEWPSIQKAIEEVKISYPLIVKPDVGFRGFLVEKIKTAAELEAHLAKFPIDFLIQEYIDYPEEIGIYYHRFPGEDKGRISSLTLKKFLSVTGDGQHSVAELMAKDYRANRQLEHFQKTQSALLEHIPAAGQVLKIGEIGNHSRGTTFINGAKEIDDQLLEVIDSLAKHVEGFNCGRFDLRCKSIADLKQGKHIKIIELNGACSEPTHMYDAQSMTYFGAIKTLAQHWGILAKVARANHRQGAHYLSVTKMWDIYQDWKARRKQINA